MQNILVVDDEKSFLEVLVKGLQTFDPNFNVLGAKNGKRAIEILESNTIDFLVTDLKMPEMDGFELLAYISRHFPSIPTIVITAFATPEAEENLLNLGTMKLMVKPVDFSMLKEAIKEGLKANSSLGSLSGVSLGGILQLVDMEQKTCLIEVNSGDRKGLIYFKEGKLYNAIYDDLRKEEAALEMLVWDEVKVGFKKLPNKNIRRRINATLMGLIIEASRLKDESSHLKSKELSDKSSILDVADEQALASKHESSGVLHRPDSGTKKDADLGVQTAKVKKDLEKTLENMSKEIPGFVTSAIVLTNEGLSMAELSVHPNVSPSAAVAYLASIVKSNIKALKLLTNDEVTEDILITTDKNYFLIRYNAGKPFFHFVMTLREEWLGRIRVMMEKYGKEILQVMEKNDT